ncbi:hypothetical protein OJAV_G00211490 [Oryzias javanicus]|uniref:Uncharacterized protein n=1 Tax=Oryzias javanicus TaxID=123683 RepID=A0A437C2U5_ORYJA|nr:hypothetical protein OJAV_G00211490 [Oryzias javanicus]
MHALSLLLVRTHSKIVSGSYKKPTVASPHYSNELIFLQAQPCSVPRPPQAWASTRVSFLSNNWGGRGRFPVCVQGPRPFVRRTQSDRRPSLSVPQRPEGKSAAETFGSEPSISSKGLEDESTTDSELWGSQSDLRATSRSASHPDLCIVGHALHRD